MNEKITISLDADLKAKIEQSAKNNRRSRSSEIVIAIEKYLENESFEIAKESFEKEVKEVKKSIMDDVEPF